MSRTQHVGVFRSEQDLLSAARACRQRELSVVDAFTPYPVHGLDAVAGIRRSRLPIVCFLAGVGGAALGLWFQVWSSAIDWPINVGGKPFDSLPAFVPVVFEMMVLVAGLATAAAFLLRARLLPGRRPRPPVDGVSDDRFALVVEARDARMLGDEIAELLRSHHAVDTRTLWEGRRHEA